MSFFPSDADYEWLAGIDWNLCATCGGKGFVNTGKSILPCPDMNCEAGQQKREELAQRMISIAHVPPQYANAVFDDLKNLDADHRNGKKLAYHFAQHFAAEGKVVPGQLSEKWQGDKTSEYNWLMFFGETGTGKTYLACAILNAMNRRGKPARYTRLDVLLDHLISSYNDKNGESKDEILNRYQEFPVLLIDEFNLSRITEHTLQNVESLVRHRAMHNRPTIMTANTSQEEFYKMWGDRISSIVIDKSVWLKMTGYTLRGRSVELSDE